MKRKLLILFITLAVILICLVLYPFRNAHRNKTVDETRTVYVKDTKDGAVLYRNGTPFFIKGVGGKNYLAELEKIGGNTIRIYDTTDIRNTLDEALKYNLAVIVDIPLYRFQTAHNPYRHKENVQLLKKSVEDLVKKYKDHPALLFWNLGNELQYPTIIEKNKIAENFSDLKRIASQLVNRRSFIKTFNELVDFIHEEDPNHPVSTSIATHYFWKRVLSIHLFSPDLDLIGYNIFAPPKKINFDLQRLSKIIDLMPCYISEWGIEGPWAQERTLWGAPIEQTSTKKAEQYRSNYQTFIEDYDKLLGGAVFFWGQKQEVTHTWFNIFDEKGRKSETYYELEHIWKNSKTQSDFPLRIKYMLVNEKGARNNIFFKPNELVNAKIFLENNRDSTLQFNWEIFEEEWNYPGGGVPHQRPKQIFDCFEENRNDTVISFKTPKIEGPYRIFAYVYDQEGNFVTTNTPFYILNPDE